MLVEKPFGWPHFDNASLAFVWSPCSPAGHRSNFWKPGINGGRIVWAMSPPANAPPKAVWKLLWSMPYMIAARQLMLFNGLTVGLIEVYQSRASVGLSARALMVGSVSTLLSAAGCTPVPAMS